MMSTTHGWEEALSHIWNMQLQRCQQAKPGGGEMSNSVRQVESETWSQRHKFLDSAVEDMMAGGELRNLSAEFTGQHGMIALCILGTLRG